MKKILVVAMVLFFSAGTAFATGKPQPPMPEPEPCCEGDITVIAPIITGPVTTVSPTIGSEIEQRQKMKQEAFAASGSNSSVKNSGNNVGNSSVLISYDYPIDLFTPDLINPVVLENELYPFLSAMNGQEINGVTVIFVDSRNVGPIRSALAVNDVRILGTQQNHGKKFLATLHSRSGEYVGPMEQAKEMVDDAPDGTRCVLIGLNTITHTRGSAGVAGTGNAQNDWTSALSANIAGSMAIPVMMTTATFIDRAVKVVNCNDPTFFKHEACEEQQEQEEK